MKNIDLSQALNYLSDETVAEADAERETPAKRTPWVKYASIAAAAVLVIAAGIFVFANSDRIIKKSPPVQIEPDVQQETLKPDDQQEAVKPDAADAYTIDELVGEYRNAGIYDTDYTVSLDSIVSPDKLINLSVDETPEYFVTVNIEGLLEQTEAKKLEGWSIAEGDENATFYSGTVTYRYVMNGGQDGGIVFCLPGTVSQQLSGQPPYAVGDTVAFVTQKNEPNSEITRVYRPAEYMYDIVEADGKSIALSRGSYSPDGIENRLLGGTGSCVLTTSENPVIYYGAYELDDLSENIAIEIQSAQSDLVNPMKPGITALSYDVMPPAFDGRSQSGGDENYIFYQTTDPRLGYIDMSLIDDDEAFSEWIQKYSAGGGVYTAVDESANLYSYIKAFDIDRRRVEEYSEIANDLNGDGFTDEEIELIYSGTPEQVAEHFKSEYSLQKGKNIYSLYWIYLHSAEDYEKAGITREDIKTVKPYFEEVGMTDEARKALDYKLDLYISGNVTTLSNPGYEIKQSETALDGLEYVYTENAEPIYHEDELPGVNPISGVDISYSELMDGADFTDVMLVEYEITDVLTKEEAEEVMPDDKRLSSGAATLYRARALYDYVKDSELDYEFYISQAGGHLMPIEGQPEYAVGKRLFSPVIFERQNYAAAIDELRFMLTEINGVKLAYHISNGSVRPGPTVRDIRDHGYPECVNIELDFADGEEMSVTTEEGNPEKYTQKSTLKSLVDFLIADWTRRGIISETGETKLSGEVYSLERVQTPKYKYVEILTENSATGGTFSWQNLLEEGGLSEDTEMYLVNIAKVYSPDEAEAICGDDFDKSSTLYRAHAYYDVLKGEAVDIYFDLSHLGNAESQVHGCPGFSTGRRYLMAFDSGIKRISVNVAEPLLEFEIYTVGAEDIAYHILGEKIRFSGDYVNLDMEMTDAEKEVVTLTENNPSRYTQKSSLTSLMAFFRDAFYEIGYLEPLADDIRLLNPTLGEVGMGFEGIELKSFDDMILDSPWHELKDELYGSEIPVYDKVINYENCGGFPFHKEVNADAGVMEEELKKLAEAFGKDIYGKDVKADYPDEEYLEKRRKEFTEYAEKGYEGATVDDVDAMIADMNVPHSMSVETENYIFTVSCYAGSGYSAKVEFKQPIDLGVGSGYEMKSAEDAIKLGQKAIEKVGKYIPGNGEPRVKVRAISSTEDGEMSYWFSLYLYRYNINDPAETVWNYNNGILSVGIEDGAVVNIAYGLGETYENRGNYRILSSEKEVIERFESGMFLSTAPIDDPNSDNIASIELSYHVTGFPFFKLWVDITDDLIKIGQVAPENGMRCYGAYYVPAVSAEYLSPHIEWNGMPITYEGYEISDEEYFRGKNETLTAEEIQKYYPNMGTPCWNISVDGEIPVFKKKLEDESQIDRDMMSRRITEIFEGFGISAALPEPEGDELKISYSSDGITVTADASDLVYKYIIEFDDPFAPEPMPENIEFIPDGDLFKAGAWLADEYSWLIGGKKDVHMGAYGWDVRMFDECAVVTLTGEIGGLKTFYKYFLDRAVFEGADDGRIKRIVLSDFENSYEKDEAGEVIHWGDEEKRLKEGSFYPASELSEPGKVLYSEIVYEQNGRPYFKIYTDNGIYYVSALA